MKNRKTLEELYNGYILGQLSAEELIDFVQQTQQINNFVIIEELVEKSFSQSPIIMDKKEGEEAFLRFQNKLHYSSINKKIIDANLKKTNIRKLWNYVAAATIIILFGFYLIQLQKPYHTARSTYQNIEDLKSENNLAYIENTNGIKTVLSSQGELLVHDNYIQDKEGNILSNQKVDEEWLNLVVPKGGKYSITLSDGTKIIINSDSKLSFTKKFATTNRHIKLNGEAYFDVSHNPDQPFIVETKLQQVHVLGTSFNISAYPEEKETTTLVTGKVNINTNGGNYDLKPGMQGITTLNNTSVQPANLESILAWKNNKFIFIKTSLPDIIKQLERWYNVPIHIHPNSDYLSKKTFSGTIDKDASLEEVLKLFKTTESIKIEVKEGRVYLMK